MTINRRVKVRSGALDPSIIKPESGLNIDQLSGQLSAEALVSEDQNINQRIDNLFWKDPLPDLNALTLKQPEDYIIGEAYYVVDAKQVYIFSGVLDPKPESLTLYQPQEWADAARKEYFLPVPAGIDVDQLATIEYVNSEILNLIDNAPGVLDTIRELAEAINNDENFATNVYAQITGLQNNKANSSDVYTKLESDQTESEIYDAINLLDSKNRRLVDLVVGSAPYSDSQDIENLLLTSPKPTTQDTLTVHLRDQVQAPQFLQINHPGYIFLGNDNKEANLNSLIIDLENTTLDDFIVFSDIEFDSIEISLTSSPVTLYLNNVSFRQSTEEPLKIFNDSKVYIENSKFLNTQEILLSANSTTEISFSTIKTISKSFNLSSNAQLKINNTSVLGYLQLNDFSKIDLDDVDLLVLQDQPSIILNADTTFASLKNIAFETPDAYSSNHIAGNGSLFANLNVHDATLNSQLNQDGSFTKYVSVDSSLNKNQGMPPENYYLPSGWDSFLYNDEKARDTIAAFLQSNSNLIWNHDDLNNTLSLTLNINSSDLSDSSNLAYLNKSNIFAATNSFNHLNTTSASIDSLQASSAQIDLLEIPTQLQSDSSNKAATTEYVRTAFSQLESDLENLHLYELKDVEITATQYNQVLAATHTTSGTLFWQNRQLSTFDLTDESSIVKAGDSVFRLTDIARPAINQQSGSGNYTGGYQSTNQVLHWNGQQYDLYGTVQKGTGQWSVSLSNDLLLKATQEPQPGVQTDYDGWGKIALADSEEVREGSSSTKAVTPALLRANYASNTLSNLANVSLSRVNLGFPENNLLYLEWDPSNQNYFSTDSTLFKYNYQRVDGSLTSSFIASNSTFYDFVGAQNLSTNIIFPNQFKEGETFKFRKSNSEGTAIFTLPDTTSYFVTNDNQIISSQAGNPAYFDITAENHTITFIKAKDENDVPFYYTYGYYLTSGNSSSAPLDAEAIQDIVAPLWTSNNTVTYAYDDPNHRVITTINFATQQEVNAGSIEDKPVSPKTLKTALDANIPTGVLLQSNNLSDLNNISTARNNLGLGSAALTNIGFTSGATPRVGDTALQVGQALIYDGTGIVSTTMSLGGGGVIYETATTTTEGVVTLAPSNSSVLSTDVVTPAWLWTRLNAQNDPFAQTIASLAGGLIYEAKNATFKADPGYYYSLSTIQGSFDITLPEISTIPIGSRIEFKYRNQLGSFTVRILPLSPDTIDLVYTEFLLNAQDQHIAFVAGIDGNWELS